MNETTARRLGWAGFILITAIYGVSLGLSAFSGSTDLFTLSTFAFPLGGLVILSRQPKSRIAWILLGIGLAWAVAGFTDGYASYGIEAHTGSLPRPDLAVALGSALWAPPIGLMGIYLILLFPDGRLPSPRWRVVAWLGGIAIAGTITGIYLAPGTLGEAGYPNLRNPLGVEGLRPLTDVLVPLFVLLIPVCVAASVVSLVQRYRRSTGDEHEQLKWLAAAAGVVAGLFGLANAVSGGTSWFGPQTPAWVEVVQNLAVFSFLLIPTAIGFAVLKYRLYDIDVVIRRTLAYSIVAGFLTAAYVGVIVGIGTTVGRFAGSSVILPIAATAIAAAGFQPVRQRARAFANRVIYGKRTSGYEALAALASGQTLGELSSKVARLATESTGIRRSVVWVSSGLELQPSASWPEEEPMPPPVRLPEDENVTFPDGLHAFSLIHQGDLLGAITAETGPGERLLAEDNRLLSDLAAHAAIAFRALLEAVVLPEGIVTFLMTDVEGSTRLWEEDPKATAAAMREHDALVRRVVQERGGILMKWRGEGDSTFSVFTAAADAISAAQALQATIAEHLWPTPRPLRVRAALHTGEAELRRRDYFGQAVNRCARLRGIASGGQTLISAATRELARDRLPRHLALVDLGDRELKDLGTERVYGLRSVGISVERRV